jgi:hypothetical protein
MQIVAGRLLEWFGGALNWLRMPGAIRPVEIDDELAGQHISVSVGEMFVCLSVNGRDYYFNRVTGRFDGTGACPG